MAPSRKAAEKALELASKKYGAKYPKAIECLEKDREELLAFYDFPAEHWQHIRTTNPIEPTFATSSQAPEAVPSYLRKAALHA